MDFRRRRMKLSDIDACVGLLAQHPEFIKLYGGEREPLRAVLRRLLTSLGFFAVVLEVVEPDQVKMFGIGAIAFLTDDFVATAKTAPFFWLGPTIIQRLLKGESPVLSDRELLHASAGDGLTVFAWPLGFRNEYLKFPEVVNYLMYSFMEEIRGYKLREYLGQTTDVEGARVSLHSGALLLTSRGTYTELPPHGVQELLFDPHLLVITRESALRRVGAWSSSIFIYNEPKIGFSRSEQRLLEAALRGLTDNELAYELEVSLSAVKKTWRSVHSRIENSGTGILPPVPADRVESSDRGKGKKHLIINYIREHPEELRPVSMKLLRQGHFSVGPNGFASRSRPHHRVGHPRSR